MKALVCEMCNSQDLVKQDGFFVCQSCGTKYSVEEAKKMMVQIEGAVKVDNSDYVERYLQNARRAKSKEDWAEVEKYYNMVEQNQPDNIEAIFYSAYGKAMLSLVDGDIFKRQAAFKVLNKSVSVLDDNYDISKSVALRPVLEGIAQDISTMCGSSFTYTQTSNAYGPTGDNRWQTYSLFGELLIEAAKTYYNIWNKFPENQRASVLYIAKLVLSISQPVLNGGYRNTLEQKLMLARICDTVESQIRTIDGSYIPKNYESQIFTAEKKAKTKKKIKALVIFYVIMIIILFIAAVVMEPLL